MKQQWLKRTHTCGELNASAEGKQVVLMGWVARRRDHGGIIFIDLRDRYGITQCVFDPSNEGVYANARRLRSEFVLAVQGLVRLRPAEMENKKLPTGEIEVLARKLVILNAAKTPPFEISNMIDASEELRLRYRYLDLRRNSMKNSLLLRHKLYQTVRRYYDENDFIEIETPMLMRSTPEGARDYLVPSRIHRGKFYALPQSPQTYKQLFMVAGFDKYFQIVKCFRDEDLRADRQPEFTQIDVEMSFVDEFDVMNSTEGLVVSVMRELLNCQPKAPFKRMSYYEAINTYGTDKPDLRFDLQIADISDYVKESEFRVFKECVMEGGAVKGICVPNAASYSRKRIDELTETAKSLGAKGLVAIKVGEDDWESNINKFFTIEVRRRVMKQFQASPGDLILIVADQASIVHQVLGYMRWKIAEKDGLINQNEYAFVWITDFPLLEYDAEEKRYIARHHPFTAPNEQDLHLMDKQPENIRARAYDLVLNGFEIAGGSIRIHTRERQDKMFSLLSISEEDARNKFGFLLDAFEYGAPPHGGIAFGLDRFAMILAGKRSIRDVIAFPKTNKALSLMDSAPGQVDDKQLNELGIKIAVH